MTAGSYSAAYDGSAHCALRLCGVRHVHGRPDLHERSGDGWAERGFGQVAPVLALNGELATNFTVTPVNGAWEITRAGDDYGGRLQRRL